MMPRMRVRQLLGAMSAGPTAPLPLVAPLISALAGASAGLTPRAFLTNATRMANLLRDLQQGLGLDVVWAEAGSLIELEVLEAPLDWTQFPPRLTGPALRAISPTGGSAANAGGDLAGRLSATRATVVVDVIARLRAMLGDRAAVGTALGGPHRLCRLLGSALSLHEAGALVLALVRMFCAAGADVLLVVEDEAGGPAGTAAYAAALDPVWATARFYQCLPALVLPSAEGVWGELQVRWSGQVLPCLPLPAAAAATAAATGEVGATGIPYGLVLPGSGDWHGVEPLLATGGRCALLTTDGELTGQVSIASLPGWMQRLRQLAAPTGPGGGRA